MEGVFAQLNGLLRDLVRQSVWRAGGPEGVVPTSGLCVEINSVAGV